MMTTRLRCVSDMGNHPGLHGPNHIGGHRPQARNRRLVVLAGLGPARTTSRSCAGVVTAGADRCASQLPATGAGTTTGWPPRRVGADSGDTPNCSMYG